MGLKGNKAMVNADKSSIFHGTGDDDLINESKKHSLLSLLNNQVEQFRDCSSTGSTSDDSQNRQRLQCQLTTEILKSVQDLLLLPLTTTFQDYRKTRLNAAVEIVGALGILADEWGKGDVQVCSTIVDTMIRIYSAATELSHDRLQGLESLQHFILLDLIPLVIYGDTENCLDAQSKVAKALIQMVYSSNDCIELSSPIIDWCRWQLDNMHLQYRRSFPSPCSFIANEPQKIMLPPEILELGLVLLKKVHAPHLLPSVFRIVLDHISVMATYNGVNDTMLLKHASDAISALRRRLIDMYRISSQSAIDSEGWQKESKSQWHLELARIFTVALLGEVARQSELLTTSYLEQLILTIEKAPQGTSRTSMIKSGKVLDQNGFLMNFESDNFHPKLLAFDWIIIAFLFSKSALSSQQSSLLFLFCDSLCEFDHDINDGCPFSAHQSLNAAMEIVLLCDQDRAMETLKSNQLTCEKSPVVACYTLEYGSIQKDYVSGFLSLFVVLLLSPARASFSRAVQSATSSGEVVFRYPIEKTSALSWIHDLTLHLFECLDSRCQEEFVTMLFHLVDETVLLMVRCTIPGTASTSSYPHRLRKRKMGTVSDQHLVETTFVENGDRQTMVLRSVYSILSSLAEKSPESFTFFKDDLVQRLLSPGFEEATRNDEVVRPICKILVSLMSPRDLDFLHSMNLPEMLLILQKLLFGEPALCGTSRVVRGIVLATELLANRSHKVVSEEKRSCIQEWVMQCLLPSTRRMVDPEIGLSGLLFLQSWISRNETSNESMTNAIVFHHFKMIVANTGLIQMVESYQSSGSSSPASSLGYLPSLSLYENLDKDPKDRDRTPPRAMLFGISFFLRHSGNIESCPGRWNFATDWVYSLVDIYLQMGRTKASKNWQPKNWLLASLELPLMNISSFKRSVNAQNLVVEWISENLCHFDISDGIQPVSFFPATHADTTVRCLSLKALRQLIDSANCLSLALLIGISLSAAVLRNAFDHTLSLESNSHCMHPLLKLQIAKIYDLHAKSLTMDSFLTDIGSALRRSLLRKKRATLVLSDDSSDDSCAAAPATSVRNIQDHNLLTNISNSLIQNRSLRSAIFASVKIVRYDIVWEALMDLEDCTILHSALVSMYTQTEVKQSEEAVMNLFQITDMKLNLVRHIIAHMENSSLLDLSVTESYVAHCVSENCFLLDCLIKLRKSCFDVMDRQIEKFNMKQNVLSNLVHLSSLYVRILFLILKRSSCLGLVGKSSFPVQSLQFDECLNLCDGYLLHKQSHTDATPLLRLFNFFSEQLTSTEYFVVAHNVLEILSLLAVSEEGELLNRVLELSWTSLHTVYGTEVRAKVFCSCAATMWYVRLCKNIYIPKHQQVIRIVNRILSKCFQKENKNNPELLCLHHGLIRHWGLLTASEFGLSILIKHLSSLILSLKSLLESIDVAFISKKNDDDDDHDYEKCHETSRSKKRRTCHTSSVFGLEVSSIADFFDTLLNLVVATTGTVNPGELLPESRNSSPYQIFEECYCVFRNMIEIYHAFILAFPRRIAVSVTCASKDMLSIAFYQLQRCIDWRNKQPLLSSQERASGQLDIGSIRYLQQLIDTTMCHTAVPILRLCDLWQSSTVVEYMKVARISTVRLIVEKVMQRIKDVAHSHNLSTSTFIGCDEIKIDEATKGFHLLSNTEDEHLCFERDPPITKNFTVDAENICDDDDSFGVIGRWGDESDFESEGNSACTLNLDNSNASLPRKKL